MRIDIRLAILPAHASSGVEDSLRATSSAGETPPD
jgi:hypothetical protein